MDKILAERLFAAGKELRQAQKRYAKTRSHENNRYRLDAERSFDAVLEECAKSVTTRQATLL